MLYYKSILNELNEDGCILAGNIFVKRIITRFANCGIQLGFFDHIMGRAVRFVK